MEQVEKRGVIVYITDQSDNHRRVGLYTEEGMLYFTLYGAKSTKGYIKSALALFTMGRFVFVMGPKQAYRFVTVDIYNNGMALSQKLPSYYAACVGIELVRIVIGADHELQFKCLVDFLLFEIQQPQELWQSALLCFLWRSLVYNGWQPTEDSAVHLPHLILKTLEDTKQKSFGLACTQLNNFSAPELDRILEIFISIWHHILGKKLQSSDFVLH